MSEIKIVDNGKNIVVMDDENVNFWEKTQIVPDYQGCYDEEKTIEECLEDDTLKIVQNGMQRGSLYYD